MKIGIVADIHCNTQALEAALSGMGDVDEVFCAGDAVNGFRWSNDVVDLLRTRGTHMVLGNHDRDFLQVREERNGANGFITPENFAFITRAPITYEIELAGRRILMLHGSPFDYNFDYIFPHSDKFKRLGELDTELFIYGHTHFSVVQQVGGVLVVNPGSTGQPRDPARPKGTYATVDLDTLEVTIHDVDVPDLRASVQHNNETPSAGGNGIWRP